VKGVEILIEPRAGGGAAAALLRDGRLEDLLIDPDPGDPAPRPEAIHRSRIGRLMKAAGGASVDLGGGLTGFLRGGRLPAAGGTALVQVSGWAEPGKAAPVTTRPLLKGRLAILTPGAPGRNLARTIPEGGRRDALAALADRAMAGAEPTLGLILRSQAEAADDAAIAAEIAGLRADWETIRAAIAGEPACLRPGPDSGAIARRDWAGHGVTIREGAAVLAEAGIWEEAAALCRPEVPLGGGWMAIEPTRALVAVDVNTGGDFSPAATLKANLAAARELPRQLRLRGLGGQVTVDFAPLSRRDRPRVEAALRAAMAGDGIETTLSGWTPLGNLELQRKRTRRPLATLPLG
jgi:Ribonuclease G/E